MTANGWGTPDQMRRAYKNHWMIMETGRAQDWGYELQADDEWPDYWPDGDGGVWVAIVKQALDFDAGLAVVSQALNFDAGRGQSYVGPATAKAALGWLAENSPIEFAVVAAHALADRLRIPSPNVAEVIDRALRGARDEA